MKTLPIIRRTLAIVLVFALALLTACAGAAEPTASPAPAPTGATSSDTPPTLEIVLPASGATVAAGTVKVAVETTNLTFVMPNNTNTPGEGHVHFTLDDRPEAMSIEREAEFEDVEPGTHRLIAELVQNDTEPFDPPIRQEIEFVVK